MATNKPRYTIIVDEDLLDKIEDFRYTERFPSRSEATLVLIEAGLKYFEKGNSVDEFRKD